MFARFVNSFFATLFILFFGLFTNVFAAEGAFSIPAPTDKVKKLSGTWEVLSYPGEGLKTQTFPINVQNVYGLAVTVSFGLRFLGMADDPSTYVRVTLLDNTTPVQREYLVYQKNYQELTTEEYNTPTQLTVESVCQETCLFQQAVGSFSLKLEAKYGGITVSEISYIDAPVSDIDPVDMRRQQNAIVIEKLNEQDLGWIAGETSVSNLTYEEKKKLVGVLQEGQTDVGEINLQGFEYYRGGIFELKSKDATQPRRTPRASTLVESFDWRNRHGKNNEENYWITPIKHQGNCGSCWAFASVGAMEAVANLYFNQPLDLDLSEQDVLSCSSQGTCAGGNPFKPNIFTSAIVDELSFAYKATDLSCSNKLATANEKFSAANLSQPLTLKNQSDDEIKRLLIEKGPLVAVIRSLKHAMTLVGFKTDPKDGKTTWIFKNSWGSTWGALNNVGPNGESLWGNYQNQGKAKDGFAHIKLEPGNLIVAALENPVNSLVKTRQINCADEDNDSYCNWGISKDKPSTCPISCKPEKDCDDLDKKKGPFDAKYNCSNINGEPDPQPPVATFTISPSKGETPLLATLDASGSSDPDSSIVSYTWSYVSNSSGGEEIPITTTTDPKITYTFTAADQYVITLIVKDSEGLGDIIKKTITVTSGKESATLPTLGKAVAFNLDGSPIPVNATFAGGISNDGKVFSKNENTTLSNYVTVSGAITPDPTHVGQSAEIVAVGYYVREGFLASEDADPANCDPALVDSVAKGGYYMMKRRDDVYCSWVVKEADIPDWCVSQDDKNYAHRKRPETAAEYFSLWDGNLQNLLALDKVTLADFQPLSTENGKTLYKGKFDAPGHVCFYFGYRLPDDTLVFNGEQTINVRIKP